MEGASSGHLDLQDAEVRIWRDSFLNSNSGLEAKGGCGSLSGSANQSNVGYSLEKKKERNGMKSKRNCSNVKKLKF